MGSKVFFSKLLTKSLTASDSDRRLFEGILTVEMKDKQNEITVRDELMKVLPVWMARGAPITDTHSNRVIGKGINFSSTTVKDDKGEEYPAISIQGEIFKDYELDDEIWKKITTGEYKGLSFGGSTKSNRRPVQQSDGTVAYSLHDLEHYEVAVCEDPAVPLALITQFNPIAKAVSGAKEIGNNKMRIRCSKFGCFIEKDGEWSDVTGNNKPQEDEDAEALKENYTGTNKPTPREGLGETREYNDPDESDHVKPSCDPATLRGSTKDFYTNPKIDESCASRDEKLHVKDAEEEKAGDYTTCQVAPYHEGDDLDDKKKCFVTKPFAGYKNFDDCVKRNSDKSNPKAYCGEIQHQVEKVNRKFKDHSLQANNGENGKNGQLGVYEDDQSNAFGGKKQPDKEGKTPEENREQSTTKGSIPTGPGDQPIHAGGMRASSAYDTAQQDTAQQHNPRDTVVEEEGSKDEPSGGSNSGFNKMAAAIKLAEINLRLKNNIKK